MIEQHQQLFDKFRTVHDGFKSDPETYKKEFNEVGQDVMRIIRRYENILCGKSESGRYGKFSSTLSDKFWNHIRTHFPKIDAVGLQ